MNNLKLKNTIIYLFFLLGFVLQSCSVSRPLVIPDKGINIEKKICLNGYSQAIVIRGADKKNPVLLHLHGGPGYPLFPYISDFMDLEKHFNVVYWEQRGTAKSLSSSLKKTSMTTDTLLNDLDELVNWVQKNVDTNKIYLWGHSWGTNLGMLYVKEHPEKIKAYIGTGQSVNLVENERLCYQFVKEKAEQKKEHKVLRILQKIDTANYSLNAALKLRKWIYAYGGIVHNEQKKKAYRNFDIVKNIFRTPEYSFADKWRLIFFSKYSGKNLWKDMRKINLFEQVKEVNCPIYFFEGRYDAIVSAPLAEKYFNYLKAKKGKHLIWFEKSAHRIQTEEPKKFVKELLNVKNNTN